MYAYAVTNISIYTRCRKEKKLWEIVWFKRKIRQIIEGGMIMAILFLIVIIGVLIVVVKKNAERDISPVVHYSDEFNHDEPIKMTNYNHIIATILICEENSDMWICPSCETENPLSKQNCCICHYVQQEGA